MSQPNQITCSLKGKHSPILLLLISFGAVTALFFTPALPQLAQDFNVSESRAQWLMTIFLIGYCIGQLPYGPLANRFGRKPAIFLGLSLSILGSLLCIAATSFAFLCFARFIQSLGAAVGLKVTFTMVNDQKSGASATKMIAFLSLALGIIPGLAVALGGFITTFAGWKGCFVFLAFYSLFLGLLCLALPETSKQLQRDSLKIKSIARGYARQFRDPLLISHAVLIAMTTSMFYIYSTISPSIAILVMGLSPDSFGFWNLITTAGLVCGVLLSRHFAGKVKPRMNIISGILIVLVPTVVMTFFFANGYMNPWTLFLPQFFIRIGTNLVWSNAASMAMSESLDKSNATAVLQFVNLAGPVIGVYLVGLFDPTTEMLLPAVYLIAITAAFLIWLSLKKKHAKTS